MQNAAATSELMSTAATYQWLLSLFALSPPPPLLVDRPFAHRRTLCLVYMSYVLLLLVANGWVTHANVCYIKNFITVGNLDAITAVLSIGVAAMTFLVQFVLQLTPLLRQRQLRNICTAVTQLEQDIRGHCTQSSTGARIMARAGAEDGDGEGEGDGGEHIDFWSLRQRLLCCAGSQLAMLLIALPYAVYILVSNQLSVPRKSATVFFSVLVQLKCVEYCVWVQLVHVLLLKVKHHLLQLRRELLQRVKRGHHSQLGCQRQLLRQTFYTDLRANQQLLARIWWLVDGVERYFTLSMLAVFLLIGLSIADTVNWTYVQAIKLENCIGFRIYYVIILLMNVMIVCWVSQCCIDTYEQFGSLVHKLKTDGTDVLLSMRLREYSLQLMHLKLVFSCGGFFDINVKYFGAIVLTLITYIVILIQFKLQGDAERSTLTALKA